MEEKIRYFACFLKKSAHQNIAVLLLPLFLLLWLSLFARCAKEPEAPQPLRIVCTSEGNVWLREKLKEYKKAHPEFLYHLETLPLWGGGEITQEIEETTLQFRTGIMAGRGPDLFWVSSGGAYLFPDPQKSMEGGAFCDLNALNEQYGGLDFSEIVPVLSQLGELKGKQYLLPIGWVPMGTVRYGESVRLSLPDSLEEYQRLSGYALTISGIPKAPACLMGKKEEPFGSLLKSYTQQVAHYAYPEQAAHAIRASGFPESQQLYTMDPFPVGFTLLEYLPSSYYKEGEPYLPHLLLLPCEGGGPCIALTQWAGIRANSGYKQEAWRLLCFLAEQAKEDFDSSLGLPVYPDKIENTLEHAERYANQGELFFSAAERSALAGCLQEALARCNYALYYSDVLRLGQEYNECFGPYFAGTQTLEECAGRWRTRLELYDDE